MRVRWKGRETVNAERMRYAAGEIRGYMNERKVRSRTRTRVHEWGRGSASPTSGAQRSQHMTQQPPLVCSHSSPVRPLLFRRWCAAVGTPSRMSIDARVAASKTSSTPSILSAEHSLYARAPMACATCSACARETKFCEFGLPSGGRRSDLQPTRRTGISAPQIERTSSIHWGDVS